MKFKFNFAQNYYWQKRRRRNIILKYRQGGITKVIDADQLVDCIRRPTNAVVMSHEKKSTSRLFEAVENFIDNLKVKPVTSINNVNEIKFPKRGSSYFVGTAGSRAFGRGDTVNRAHLSEAAFYPDLESTLNGIAEACEFGQIDIESTPNGHNKFHEVYLAAKNGQSSYTAIFLPWFTNPDYSADKMTEKEKSELSDAVVKLFSIPDAEFIAQYTDEEKELVAKVAEEWGILLSPGQIKWRRCKIWDKGIYFFQEYPEDDISCFLQNERSVFTQITTKPELKIPLDNLSTWRPTEDEETNKVLREHIQSTQLFGFVDGAEGIPDGDFHSFAVIAFLDNQFRVVYDYTSREPYDVFDYKVSEIVKNYNFVFGCEKNGIGKTHIEKFKTLGLDVYEWNTEKTSRSLMISQLEEAYRKEELIESYPEAERQARDMEYTDGRAEHKQGGHDDRVFARAGAWQMIKLPTPGITIL